MTIFVDNLIKKVFVIFFEDSHHASQFELVDFVFRFKFGTVIVKAKIKEVVHFPHQEPFGQRRINEVSRVNEKMCIDPSDKIIESSQLDQ
jgi:hypothetical protein